MAHELKITPEYFKEVLLKRKKFEIRYNDRNYKAGELLILQEYDPFERHYSGNKVARIIERVYTDLPGLQKDYVILQTKEPRTNPFLN